MSNKSVIYDAHVQNEHALRSAKKQMQMLVNDAIKRNNVPLITALTKSLVLLFSAWSEANFWKLIYTPYGFSDDEISQIMRAYFQSLEQAWEKCIELGLRRVASDPKRSNYLPNVQQRLSRIVQEYVIKPRIIRNKIAHGQWRVVLNRDKLDINNEITASVNSLDPVIVLKWFDIFFYLSSIIEVLIESPNRAFHRDYWVILAELEEYLRKTQHWNIETKREVLLRRKK